MSASLPHYDIEGARFVSSDYQARPNDQLKLDARGGPFAIDLPPSARDGDELWLEEPYGWNAVETNPVTIRRNGSATNIDGAPGDWLFNKNGAVVKLTYYPASDDWVTSHSPMGAAPSSTATLNLAGLAGKPVVVNPTEDGFVEMTGIAGGNF